MHVYLIIVRLLYVILPFHKLGRISQCIEFWGRLNAHNVQGMLRCCPNVVVVKQLVLYAWQSSIMHTHGLGRHAFWAYLRFWLGHVTIITGFARSSDIDHYLAMSMSLQFVHGIIANFKVFGLAIDASCTDAALLLATRHEKERVKRIQQVWMCSSKRSRTYMHMLPSCWEVVCRWVGNACCWRSTECS